MAKELAFKINIEGSKEQESKLESIKKSLIDLKKERTELNKATKKGAEASSAQIKRLGELDRGVKALSANERKLTKEILDQNKVVQTVSGSYEDLVEQNKSLRVAMNKLPIDDTTGELEKLQKQFNDNNDKLKDFDKSLGQNFRNVGNYKDAISEAVGEINVMGVSYTSIKDKLAATGKVFQAQKAAVQGTTAATSGLSKGLRILKVALISTGIGAIVVALGALITALTKTQGGMDFLSKITSQVGQVVNVLISRLGMLANAVIKVFKGDFKGAVEDAKNSVKDIDEALGDAIKTGAKIAELEKKFKSLNNEVNLLTTSLQSQKDLMDLIADDNTRSFKEREDAAGKARKINAELAAAEIARARAEQDLVTLRTKSMNDQIEADKLRVEASIKVQEAENNLLLVQKENEKTLRELKQDRLERDLDILIDGFDNVKTINEKIINDDKRVLEEREALFRKTVDLSNSSFDEQIKTIQKFTNEQVNANDLLATSDAKLLNEKIRKLGLSEIIEGRLLEVIRDKRTATSDLAELERSLNDAREAKEAEDAKKRTDAITEQGLAEIEEKKRLKQLELESLADVEEEVSEPIFEAEMERFQQRADVRLELLKAQLDAQLITEQQYEGEKNRIIDEANEKRKKADLILASTRISTANSVLDTMITIAGKESALGRGFIKFQQSLALAEVGINLAQELSMINKNPIVNADVTQATRTALIAAALARGAGIVSTIVSTDLEGKKQQFQDGGMIHGPGHDQGGVPFTVNGAGGFEAEGGEVIFSRKSVDYYGADRLLNMNSIGNGFTPTSSLNFFRDGGQVSSNAQSLQNENLQQSISDTINSIQVVNVVTETTEQQISVSSIETEATII